MRQPGFFITFEGTDGVGKTTQMQLLSDWLQTKGYRAQTTREPGGGVVAEEVRRLVLHPDHSIAPMTELLLYQAARAQHVADLIRPALKKKRHVVICDRFIDSTIAYQGYARGLMKEAKTLNELVANDCVPDLTLLLDLPPKQGLGKALKRTASGKGDRLENEGVVFQQKVRRGFLEWSRKNPKRIVVIKVQPSIEKTQALIQEAVEKKLHERYRTSARA